MTKRMTQISRWIAAGWLAGPLLAWSQPPLPPGRPLPPDGRRPMPPGERPSELPPPGGPRMPMPTEPVENVERVDSRLNVTNPLDTSKGFPGVGLESLDDIRSMVITGPQDQVNAFMRVIEEIDRLSAQNSPDVRVALLRHADSENLAKLLTKIYESKEGGTTGGTTTRGSATAGKTGFIAIAQPNAIVVVAQQIEIERVMRFVFELDEQSQATDAQFKIIPITRASASSIESKLTSFFASRTDAAGLRVRVEVVADDRTNSIMIFAGPSDLQQAETLVKQLDGIANAATVDIRIFPLKHAVAADAAVLLNDTISTYSVSGDSTTTTTTPQQGARTGGQAGGQQARPGGGAAATSSSSSSGSTVAKLRMTQHDEKGRLIESSILENITVTADERSNSLIVTAPAENMGLIAKLIEQLDDLPNPAAQIKVFTMENSDAEAMLDILQTVFLSQQQGANRQGGLGGGQQQQNQQQITFAIPGQKPEVSRVQANFAIDTRTNSIIATASANDLVAIEALILKLDLSNARERKTIVYRLNTLTALDAATAISNFLNSQSQIAQNQDGRIALSEQIGREVSVVSESISNSLLISSTPRFMDEILRIIKEIDRRPPQVMIQVLIAEVQLNDNEDFGVEFGVQNPVLFDRSLQVRNTTLNAQVNSLTPGFNFNTTDALQSPVGVNSGTVGLQGLTNFALGRGNPAGFGGLILSASSDNLSVLLRALRRQQRLDILSRPQVMTQDNQSAFIQIGQLVPTVTGTNLNPQGGVTNSVQFQDVGIILQVTPRISPEGVVVMRVEPTVSSLDANGVPIAVSGTGQVTTAPIINTTRAQTTISAADGETVVLGGLISKSDSIDDRKLPWVGDWPLLGWLFRTRLTTNVKRELIIILTPHIVYGEHDAQRVKCDEVKRIDWILSDVEWAHGKIGCETGNCPTDGNCPTVIDGEVVEPMTIETPALPMPAESTIEQPAGPKPMPLNSGLEMPTPPTARPIKGDARTAPTVPKAIPIISISHIKAPTDQPDIKRAVAVKAVDEEVVKLEEKPIEPPKSKADPKKPVSVKTAPKAPAPKKRGWLPFLN